MITSLQRWLGKHGYLCAIGALILLLLIDFGLRYFGAAESITDPEPGKLISLFGFYPVWTLLSAGFFVALGNIIAFLFRRRESYYDE